MQGSLEENPRVLIGSFLIGISVSMETVISQKPPNAKFDLKFVTKNYLNNTELTT